MLPSEVKSIKVSILVSALPVMALLVSGNTKMYCCLTQEFNKIPMFMKNAPEEIDPQKYPELACLQSIIHDEDRPPEGVRTTAFSPPRLWMYSWKQLNKCEKRVLFQNKQKAWKMKAMPISKRRTTKRRWWPTQRVWRRNVQTRTSMLSSSPTVQHHTFTLVKKKKHPNVLLLSQKMTLFKKDMSGFFFFPWLRKYALCFEWCCSCKEAQARPPESLDQRWVLFLTCTAMIWWHCVTRHGNLVLVSV